MRKFLTGLGTSLLDFSLASLTYLILFFLLNLIASQVFISIYLLAGVSHGLLPPTLLNFIIYLPDLIFWLNILCLAVAMGGYFVILRPVVWWALRVKPEPKMTAPLALSLVSSSLVILFLVMIVSIWKSALKFG